MHCRQCHQYVSRPSKTESFTCVHCGSTQKPYLFNFKEILGLVAIVIIVPLLCFIAWQLALFKDKVADNLNHQVNTHLAQGISSFIPDNANGNNTNNNNGNSGNNANASGNQNNNANNNQGLNQEKLQQSLSILGTLLKYLDAGDN
jgi:hypothetical protein